MIAERTCRRRVTASRVGAGQHTNHNADDAREVTLRQRHSLDLAYLEPRIRELGALLERPEIVARWKRWKHEGAD
jgi:hypothetical protein